MTLLRLDNIETYIGQYHILQGVSLDIPQGEITVLFGRNGAGKTTTLRTIMGLCPPTKGTIKYKGESIDKLPTYKIAQKGIGYVPEDQGIFHDLTVEEHMKLAMLKENEEAYKRLEWMLELFPDLRQFWKRKGGLLSGGQKQMLAITRAYLNNNEMLLIDEPSKGLAPIVVEKLMYAIKQMKEKTTVVLVEQNYIMASGIGDRFTIIDDGKSVYSGLMQELKGDEAIRRQYLGIA